jgi:hypothetical protein
MRLNKLQIDYLAFIVAKALCSEKLVIVEDREKFKFQVEEVITKELQKEDELEERVKEILNDQLEEIRNSNIDYFQMFKMVKRKLAKQENIIL